jgi:hypothetical protein
MKEIDNRARKGDNSDDDERDGRLFFEPKIRNNGDSDDE